MNERRMFEALTLDVHGTVVHPREPVEVTYARIAREHGLDLDPDRLRGAFWQALDRVSDTMSMEGDGRPFWREVVTRATGSDDPDLFEALYRAYAVASRWRVEPGFRRCCDDLRMRGVRIAFLSNADDRLRPLLVELDLLRHVDTAIISAEVGVSKPAEQIFRTACERLGVTRQATLHVGDSRKDDIVGARHAGLQAWHWTGDVPSFDELRCRVLDRLRAPTS